jgi:hypothetical protein
LKRAIAHRAVGILRSFSADWREGDCAFTPNDRQQGLRVLVGAGSRYHDATDSMPPDTGP